MVGVTGIEPATSWSQTTRAPICATPRSTLFIIVTMDHRVNSFYINIKNILQKKLHID